MYGVIATGSPIKSGFVFIKGSNNIEKTEISSNGEYRIDINNLAEPYKLKAISDEMDSVLYSYSHRYGNANITPLTSLVVFEANGQKSLNAFYNSSETLSSNDLENADLIVKSNLAPYIYYAGISYNEFNIISDAFKPNHFGHDALLDRLKIEVMDTNNIVIKDVLTNEDVAYKSEIKNADSYVDESNFSRRIIKKISISTKDAETFMSQIIDDLIDQKIIEYHYNLNIVRMGSKPITEF
ncbi:MAG: hypothetical protein OMM_04944 [Candidatus Magnetoglobus multicellularis str. Araruama]|uniref:Uncharacterized protein n=2 Tax=Candidatus Magnetoglobus multicellularis str. Araruama TaxID=890399 RepID=A0A1V1NZ16_9BACT|nr:MAG: hypothetical protein OMM_04944 [Candidatus Magnetoglobus multicellularis str. Araruama]